MYMFAAVLRELDAWVDAANREAAAEGVRRLPSSTVHLLGQTALLESRVDLTLTATQDVDVYADCPWVVRKELERLLKHRGKVLDPHGSEVWMPEETLYEPVYEGDWVTGLVAQADFVLLSKALKAPEKNRALIVEFLAEGATPRFLDLSEKYDLDLEQFV